MTVANLVLPLLSIPVLTRALGVEEFGKYAWVSSAGILLAVVCDFGFNWSAGQQISVLRGSRDRIAKILVEAIVVRAMLLGTASVVLVTIWLFCRCGSPLISLLPLVAFVAATTLLVPQWLFQGLERFDVIALWTSVGRIIAICSIVLLVRSPDDTVLAIFLSCLGGLVPGIVSFRFIRRQYPNLVQHLTISGLCERLRSAASVFVADAAIQLYTLAQTFLVGLLGGATLAGYFHVADRSLGAGKSLLGSLIQAAMPRVAYLAEHDPKRGFELILRVMLVVGGIGTCGTIFIVLFSDEFIQIVFGSEFAPAAEILLLLSPVPALIGFGSCFSTLFLFNYCEKRVWIVAMYGAATASATIFFLGHQIGYAASHAAALGIVCAEATVLFYAGCRFVVWIRSQHRRP